MYVGRGRTVYQLVWESRIYNWSWKAIYTASQGSLYIQLAGGGLCTRAGRVRLYMQLVGEGCIYSWSEKGYHKMQYVQKWPARRYLSLVPATSLTRLNHHGVPRGQ